MKKIFPVVCILSIAVIGLQAQKVKFNNITGQGIITIKGAGFTAQTINGIKYKSWSAGIGVGYDNYKFSNIPVFLDVRKYFGDNKIKAFVYVDAGISHPLYTSGMPRRKEGEESGYIMHSTFYGEVGTGISFPVGKINFLLSAGYCTKELKYDAYLIFEDYMQNSFIDPVRWPMPPAYYPYTSFDYMLSGLCVRTSISF